jgi:hypothetical protein
VDVTVVAPGDCETRELVVVRPKLSVVVMTPGGTVGIVLVCDLSVGVGVPGLSTGVVFPGLSTGGLGLGDPPPRVPLTETFPVERRVVVPPPWSVVVVPLLLGVVTPGGSVGTVGVGSDET